MAFHHESYILLKSNPREGRLVSVFFGTEPDFAFGITSDHPARTYNICY